MTDPHISVFANATTTAPMQVPLTISEALGNIRSGVWKDYVIYLRGLPYAEYQTEKKNSHALTFQGTFLHRANAGIVTPAGACVLDYDGFASTSEAAALRDKLAKDLHVVAAFLSPSAKGVKVVVKVPGTTDNEAHKRNYESLTTYFGERYGAPKTDKQAKDLARLCFVSYDPDLRERPYAETLTFEPPAAPLLNVQPVKPPASPAPAAKTITPANAADALDEARRHLHNLFSKANEAKQQGPGESRHGWMLSAAKIARQYVLGGIPESSMRDVLISEYLALFDAGEHGIRKQDAIRAFNGRKTLDLAQLDGALTPDPSRSSLHEGEHRQDAGEAHDDNGRPAKYTMTLDTFQKLSREKTYRPDWTNKPAHVEAPITLNDVPISTFGGITAIAALPGTGKTVVCGAIWAAANGKKTGDTLGFKVKDGLVAEYIDTEQPGPQHYATWERAMRRAGYAQGELPEHVAGRYHLASGILDPHVLAAYVVTLIEHGDADIYVVDGIADLVKDPNDLPESIEIIRLFEDAAAKYGVTIVTTIHYNDKANAGLMRGHLGGQISRKSTTAMRIDQHAGDDLGKVSQLWIPPGYKTRFSPEVDVWFTWSDAEGMHVTTEQRTTTAGKKNPVTREACTAIFTVAGTSSLPYKALVTAFAKHYGIQERQAKNKVKEAKEKGFVNDYLGSGQAYSLAPETIV